MVLIRKVRYQVIMFKEETVIATPTWRKRERDEEGEARDMRRFAGAHQEGFEVGEEVLVNGVVDRGHHLGRRNLAVAVTIDIYTRDSRSYRLGRSSAGRHQVFPLMFLRIQTCVKGLFLQEKATQRKSELEIDSCISFIRHKKHFEGHEDLRGLRGCVIILPWEDSSWLYLVKENQITRTCIIHTPINVS